jgi:dihydrofolate reductase
MTPFRFVDGAADRTIGRRPRMRKVIANEWMTLNGVVQAPSYPDEDVTGGFRHGGWHSRYLDEQAMDWVVGNICGAGGYLLGRGTYENFAAHWPTAPREQQALAEPLNRLPKYVASMTLDEPLHWSGAMLLRGELGTAVRALKAEEGSDLHLIGSPGLFQSLLGQGLIDELRVMIDPVVVGDGKRLFGDDGSQHPLRLADSQVTSTGAIIATYVCSSGEHSG